MRDKSRHLNAFARCTDPREKLRGLTGDQTFALSDNDKIVRNLLPDAEKSLDQPAYILVGLDVAYTHKVRSRPCARPIAGV